MKQLLSDYDVIIIGSGIAGLYTALKLDPSKRVLVVTKSHTVDSNTNLAQGGVAVTFDKKDYSSHVEDTMKTGFYHNDEKRLYSMIEEGSNSINTLINWGVNFDSDDDGNLLFTKEGGHSRRRILHFKDTTGQEIIRGLLEASRHKSNIEISEYTYVSELISQNDEILGIRCIKDNVVNIISAPHVVIATGGVGEIYLNTTNASIATGDGIAMAYEVGAEVADMEFVQFHPTALNVPGHSHFLISEAVRGEGGILRNEIGEAFMNKYHPLKDLAPRSVVSKAIFDECVKQGNYKVYLDVTHLPEKFITDRFPNIYGECLKRGINILKEWIPIIPVQHYMMGGIKTDAIGRTAIKGLYACGEVACTGVHGANRMASNSLLEGAVFANRVAEDINESHRRPKEIDNETYKIEDSICDVDLLKKKLQGIMSKYAFIFRNRNRMIEALGLIDDISDQLEHVMNQESIELKNMVLVCKLIVRAAINRETSLGSHIIEGE